MSTEKLQCISITLSIHTREKTPIAQTTRNNEVKGIINQNKLISLKSASTSMTSRYRCWWCGWSPPRHHPITASKTPLLPPPLPPPTPPPPPPPHLPPPWPRVKTWTATSSSRPSAWPRSTRSWTPGCTCCWGRSCCASSVWWPTPCPTAPSRDRTRWLWQPSTRRSRRRWTASRSSRRSRRRGLAVYCLPGTLDKTGRDPRVVVRGLDLDWVGFPARWEIRQFWNWLLFFFSLHDGGTGFVDCAQEDV